MTVSNDTTDLMNTCDVVLGEFDDEVKGRSLVDTAIGLVAGYSDGLRGVGKRGGPDEVVAGGLVSRKRAEALCRWDGGK